jgi:S-adenosylmethionine decarboxylase
MKYLTYGRHIIVDAWQIDFSLVNDEEYLLKIMEAALHESGATILSVQSKSFSPQGITILFLLSESHLSIHTYPEKGFAAIDCYTCGNSVDPQVTIDYLISALKPEKVYTRKLIRGNESIEISDS